ncbi:MAG: TauD/TfdA dioxygenase family protein [Acidimicrobiales bacterium]
MPATDAALDTRPVAGRIGAEIAGVDLSSDLGDEVVAGIEHALVTHKVIFFRDQLLDEDSHVAFARRLGPLTSSHPTVPSLDGHANIHDLDVQKGARANYWHTDVTFVDRPPKASVLRAVDVPPFGGDTVWANTASAYADLPAELRAFVDGLAAVHTNAFDYVPVRPAATSDAAAMYRGTFTSTVYETLHPIVRVHPVTGEPSILLGGFAQKIDGLPRSVSRELIRTLQDYVTRPENTVRWRWRPGDVAIWDNRATQHYALIDFGDRPRRVQRVTVAGPVPVGLDGRVSRALRGDASSYSPIGR